MTVAAAAERGRNLSIKMYSLESCCAQTDQWLNSWASFSERLVKISANYARVAAGGRCAAGHRNRPDQHLPGAAAGPPEARRGCLRKLEKPRVILNISLS